MIDKLTKIKETIIKTIDDNIGLCLGVTLMFIAICFICIPLYHMFFKNTPDVIKEDMPMPPKVLLGCSDQFELMHSDVGFRIIKDKKTGYEYVIVYTNSGIAITPRKGVIPKKEILHDMEKTEAGKER